MVNQRRDFDLIAWFVVLILEIERSKWIWEIQLTKLVRLIVI